MYCNIVYVYVFRAEPVGLVPADRFAEVPRLLP